MTLISNKGHTAPAFCSAITAFEEEFSRNSEDCRFLSYFASFFLANPTGGDHPWQTPKPITGKWCTCWGLLHLAELLSSTQDSFFKHTSLLGPNNCRWGSEFCSAALLGGERDVMEKRRKVLFTSSPSPAGVEVLYGAPLQPWGEKRKEWKSRHSKTKANHINSSKWSTRLVLRYVSVIIAYIYL